MQKKYLWTKSQARLQLIDSNNKGNFNWIFIPGGPGLGSEYLSELTSLLQLPGIVWHFDFPNDGSNIIAKKSINFNIWKQALIEAISALNNVILVTHSFSGMFALTIPKLEKLICGFVIMDSAPDKSWQKYFQQYVNNKPILKAEKIQKKYLINPSNKTLKDFVVAGARYCVANKELIKYIAIVKTLAINYKAYDWSVKKFHTTYRAHWIPKKIPTLIFAGDKDYITPLKLFLQLRKFNRKNILIKIINNAGHYPWLENPNEVIGLFNRYFKSLKNIN